jgi:PKD repeat protein
VAKAGKYWVIVTSTLGCTGSDTINILPTTTPIKAGFLANTFVSEGDTIQFIQLSTPKPTSFVWNFGDGTTNNKNEDPLHQFFLAREYTVTLIANNGNCSDTATKKITVKPLRQIPSPDPVGLFTEILDYSIYPNPTNGPVTFDIELNRDAPVEIFIFNLQGKFVESRTVSGKELTEKFDFSTQPSGIYILKFRVGNEVRDKRIIKQ